MTDQPPPADPPLWKGRWRNIYLISIGLTGALTLAVPMLEGDWPGRGIGFGLGIVLLFLLVDLGVGIAICDRDYWRLNAPALDILLTLALLFLSVVSLVAFFVFAILALKGLTGHYH
jgi:hypothetical protein